ncbi:translational machinery component [Pseudovirgaria hyperparasitica]|uniref:Translational machinery component n=1 Tax=Pseudovirgaria hyperparasitica TaxID=470096 RepID=A0A6A6WFE9_9PEZI|nr:translational machinery component [Pseudovirgaria hyperparasitica]KAF2761548.1 translational machinery component [Pseudovirgaria hyperparasitica]
MSALRTPITRTILSSISSCRTRPLLPLQSFSTTATGSIEGRGRDNKFDDLISEQSRKDPPRKGGVDLVDNYLSEGARQDTLAKQLRENETIRNTDPEGHQKRQNELLGMLRGMDVTQSLVGEQPAHCLHIYSHKHNTHITLTDPKHEAIINVSTGNLGFRKSGRKTFDAGYQLAAFVLNKIAGNNSLRENMKQVHLSFRGFGQGREGATKAIVGTEGMVIRNKVRKVTDVTPIAHGGPRGSKPRRLG